MFWGDQCRHATVRKSTRTEGSVSTGSGTRLGHAHVHMCKTARGENRAR
jgi:hypothetical protein